MYENKKILLVDDDPLDRELIINSLREAGIGNKIDIARDGEEAMDYLFAGTKHHSILLILLDIKMPKLNGLEVLKNIRESPATENIPVVMLTSSKEDVDIYNSYKYRANSFVCKPVNFDDFQDVVKKIGLFWCLVNETTDTA